jgi:hypothetical protein
MTAGRTQGNVAGEGAVRKAWSATVHIDSTAMVYSNVSTRPSVSTWQLNTLKAWLPLKAQSEKLGVPLFT